MRKEYDFSKGKRGPIISPQPNKTRITIRIDTDILDWFRNKVYAAGGGNYQTMINDALRLHIKHQNENLEDIVRRVIREEIRAAVNGEKNVKTTGCRHGKKSGHGHSIYPH